MEIAGGCQCGSIRYTTTDKPVRAMACHCTTCKLRTGAPYGVGVYFNDEDVQIVHGDIQTYKFTSDTSGRWIQNEFCPVCSTCVFWTLEMRPGLRAVAGGTFDDPNWYSIEAHIWTRSAREDMQYPQGMRQCEEALK